MGRYRLSASAACSLPQMPGKRFAPGASLIELYTGFIYEGPSVARRINEGLRRILSQEGFVSLDEAVGCQLQNRER
jgi:dihydroorotate dehydrogenase